MVLRPHRTARVATSLVLCLDLSLTNTAPPKCHQVLPNILHCNSKKLTLLEMLSHMHLNPLMCWQFSVSHHVGLRSWNRFAVWDALSNYAAQDIHRKSFITGPDGNKSNNIHRQSMRRSITCVTVWVLKKTAILVVV